MDKEKFLNAYNNAENLMDLGFKLDISRNQIRYYIRKYYITEPPPKRSKAQEERQQLEDEIFFHFRSLRTMRSLIYQYDLCLTTIRKIIDRGIKKMYRSENPPIWPRPKKLSQIKIVKSLIMADKVKDWHDIQDIDSMALNHWLPRKTVEEYYAIEKVAEELEHRKHFQEFKEEDEKLAMSPVEQLCELCRDPYQLPPEDELTELEKDKMIAKETLTGKEHLSPVEQLRALIIEQRAQWMEEHANNIKF